VMRSSGSSDLLDRPSDTVSQKDVSPVTSNANELLFHKQANSMTNSRRTFASVRHSRRLYAPESHKHIQNSLEVLSVLCQINPIPMVTSAYCFLTIRPNIIFHYFPNRFSNQILLTTSHLLHSESFALISLS
jgi:hypothetical protein